MSPRASSANRLTFLYGDHMVVSPMGPDDIDIRIGGSICGLNPDLSENPFVACTVPNSEAGFYNISESAFRGYARTDDILYTRVKSGDYPTYQFEISPTISSISAHTGPTKGNLLTIQGTGFPNDPTKAVVTVAGLPCTVI